MNFFNFTIGSTGSAQQTWLSTVLPGVTVALIAGVAIFLLNWFREWLTAFLKRKSEAEVLAFSLVTQFDHLISQCADVVDDPLHQDRESQCWESTKKTPDFLFADGITWSVFPKALQYRIRSLPNKIDVTDRNIGSLWDYGGGPQTTVMLSRSVGGDTPGSVWRHASSTTCSPRYGVADTGEWDPRGPLQTRNRKNRRSPKG